jgi:hypothetical protein
MIRRHLLLTGLMVFLTVPADAQSKAKKPKWPPLRKGAECEIVLFGDEGRYAPFYPRFPRAASAGAVTPDAMVVPFFNPSDEDRVNAANKAYDDAVLAGDRAGLDRLVKQKLAYSLAKGDHIIAENDMFGLIQCRITSGASIGGMVQLHSRNLKPLERAPATTKKSRKR